LRKLASCDHNEDCTLSTPIPKNSMDLHLSTQQPLTWSGDCLVIGVLASDLPLAGLLADLDQQLSGLVQELVDEAEFKPKRAAAPSSG
jgi:hypothetical protein